MIHADVEDSVREEVLGKFKCFYLFKCQRGLSQLVKRTFCCNPFVLFYFLFVFEKDFITVMTAILVWNRILMHYILKLSVFNLELKTMWYGNNCFL